MIRSVRPITHGEVPLVSGDRIAYLDELAPYRCRCRPGHGWRDGSSTAPVFGCCLCSADRVDYWDAKHRLVQEYAWAIPSEEALAALVRLGPITEVGSGTGYWAALLQARGVDVVATDLNPPSSARNGYGHLREWCRIERADGRKVAARSAARTLMFCWPSCQDNWAAKALKAYKGATVAYVGEYDGGCCATDDFFARLDSEWTEAATVDLPQWWGLHDGMTVYQRKEG
jgi:hypothetical protein